MKRAFRRKNFTYDHRQLIETCNDIIDQYMNQGYTLTLRQLYYQLVARAIIPNDDRQYKRLGKVVADGRDCGLIDWDAIEDRLRNLKGLQHWYSPEEIIEESARIYRRDLWKGQDYYVEIWVEKDALGGVVQQTANELDCNWLACRGYMSQSEMYAAGRRYARMGQDVVVIHLGDHDPSGIDMTRDIGDRLALYSGQRITINRVALNFDQVEQYDPPPNPAKVTDSRYENYRIEYGDESWELDALDPSTLDAIIKDAVEKYVDREEMDRQRARMESEREALENVAANWDSIMTDYAPPDED